MSHAAQILAAHRVTWDDRTARTACTCGWMSDDPAVFTDLALHEAHVLAVLSETHAVVELPEPDDVGKWGSVWQNNPVVGTVQALPDGSCEIRGDFEYTYTAADLATAGAILIAAAKVATR